MKPFYTQTLAETGLEILEKLPDGRLILVSNIGKKQETVSVESADKKDEKTASKKTCSIWKEATNPDEWALDIDGKFFQFERSIKPLNKVSIVVWTPLDVTEDDSSLKKLYMDSLVGTAYVSHLKVEHIQIPPKDKQWSIDVKLNSL